MGSRLLNSWNDTIVITIEINEIHNAKNSKVLNNGCDCVKTFVISTGTCVATLLNLFSIIKMVNISIGIDTFQYCFVVFVYMVLDRF